MGLRGGACSARALQIGHSRARVTGGIPVHRPPSSHPQANALGSQSRVPSSAGDPCGCGPSGQQRTMGPPRLVWFFVAARAPFPCRQTDASHTETARETAAHPPSVAGRVVGGSLGGAGRRGVSRGTVRGAFGAWIGRRRGGGGGGALAGAVGCAPVRACWLRGSAGRRATAPWRAFGYLRASCGGLAGGCAERCPRPEAYMRRLWVLGSSVAVMSARTRVTGSVWLEQR